MITWAVAILWSVRVEAPCGSMVATESHKGKFGKDGEKRHHSTRCLHIEGASTIIILLSWLDIVDEAVNFHRPDVFKAACTACLKLARS